jgi:hypothetical protein
VPFPQSGSSSTESKLELREVLSFVEGGKTGEPRKKPLKQGRESTNNSTHMTLSSGVEPGTTEVRGER